MPRLTPIGLFLLIGSAACLAGDPRILGRDDDDFARGLLAEGYRDLAEGVVAAIEKAGPTPEKKVAIESLRIEMQYYEARFERDPIKRKDLFLKVIEAQEKFVEKNKSSPAARTLLDALPDFYRSVGEAIAAAAKDEQDPVKATAMRREGTRLFERAEDALATRLEKAREDVKNAESNDDPQLRGRVAMALYGLARTLYFHMTLAGDEAGTKESLKTKALGIIEEIQLDFDGELVAYEALIVEGLVYKETGDADKALASLNAAIKIRDLWEKDAKGYYAGMADTPAAGDVASAAFLQKVIVLREIKKDNAAAILAGDDFMRSIPDAPQTSQGMLVLLNMMEAKAEAGDVAGSERIQKLILKVAPNSQYADEVRTFQSKSTPSADMGPAEIMKIARSVGSRGDLDRAGDLCRQAVTLSKADLVKFQDTGAEAYVYLGQLFSQRAMMNEAAIAWDAAVNTFPKAATAPDALWSSINAYVALGGQDKRAFHRKAVDERMARLAKDYPNSPHTSKVVLIAGQRLEAEGDLLGAAKSFEQVRPTPNNPGLFEEAQYRAGSAYSKLVWKLMQDGKTAEAAPHAKKAEDVLKKSRADLQKAADATLDMALKTRLLGLVLSSRLALANLYLALGPARAPEVITLLDGVESEYPNERDRLDLAWDIRFRSFKLQGKFDDAMVLLDAQLKKDPNNRALASAAGVLARELDKRAAEAFKKDPNSPQGTKDLRKAADYYVKSVAPQIKGEDAIRADVLEGVAQRLYGLALQFGGVPETVLSFTEFDGQLKETEYFRESAKAYSTLLDATDSYRSSIALSQDYGYLGEYKDAARTLAELFDKEPIEDKATKRLSNNVMREKPELLYAYIDWGILEKMAYATDTSDTSPLVRASAIFQLITDSTTPEMRQWWQAKYHVIEIIYDRGDYEKADLVLRAIERGNEDYDGGKFNWNLKFRELRKKIDAKVFPGGKK